MERNSEASSVAIRALQQQLDTERDERVAFEDSMMRLVEEQLSKVHMGIEAHPNVSSEHWLPTNNNEDLVERQVF